MLRLPLRATAGLTNWFYGFAPPERGTIVLGHRRVYIVPSRLGLLFGGVLLILLMGSINYTLSLGFALTFLLAGTGLAGMVQTTRNLARLAVQRRPRRTGLRRRARAVPAGAGQWRRIRPARNPAAPPRLGRAMQASMSPAAGSARGGARGSRRAARLAAARARDARDALSARPVPRLELRRARLPVPRLSAPGARRAAAARAQRCRPAARARMRRAATIFPACAPTSRPIRRATWPGNPWRAATPASRNETC